MIPLDSEIEALGKVLEELRKKQTRDVDLEGFRKEIIGRCAEAGWVAQVDVYSTNVDDCYAFDINLVDRCEPKPTDYERMRWEIRKDILDVEPEKKGMTATFTEAGLPDSFRS